MVTSRTTLELFYDLWPLYFQITSIWKERIEIGLLTPTNHTWGSSIAWSSNVKWPLFLVLAFPYGSCFPCLHSEGTKAKLHGAGITAEPKHTALDVLFVCLFSFVFITFLPILATSLPLGHAEFSKSSSISPDLWAHWFLVIWWSLCCRQDLPPSLFTAHLQPKLHIPVVGPPSSLTFQFTIFSHLGHGSVFLLDLWWVFLLL